MKHEVPDSIGLPYASADVDAEGYHLVCPVCGWLARAEGGRTEDEVTKGAGIAYSTHFLNEAGEGR